MDKNNKYLTQYERVKKFLYKRPATRLEISVKTGILIQNVCRYVAMLRKQEQIAIIKHDTCQISGQKSEYLSTNPVYFKEYGKQMTLF